MGEEESLPLFETKEAKFRGVYKIFAWTIFAAICLIWVYRLTNIPSQELEGSWWAWITLLLSELAFGFYWIITQSVRWRIVYQTTFKQRLSHRFKEDNLPTVDIFVCTADPILEPPMIVINTVLSVMAYNYPSNKLSVYLSDDGGSELTFYALLKASIFSKHWLPFCRRFSVEPRSPEAYFSSAQNNITTEHGQAWLFIKIIIDGRDKNAIDEDGLQLPTMVYVAREKRPNYPHHFKGGALNALIRVSSEISNAPFILNLDCDMYSNNADIIHEILCFFLDEKKGHEIAYVQFPQSFSNITKNDHYENSYLVAHELELASISGYGASMYCGTGCFHRRESLSGTHLRNYMEKLDTKPKREDHRTINELIEASKALATCTYEQGTQWGNEMGLVYGIPVEDIATGLVISCRGWKSIYYNPKRKAFMGVAPTTLEVGLVQHKRWSEGLFQIFFSKYCPFIYGYGKIKLGLQIGYCVYLLWAPLSLPTLCYAIVPPICLICGISLFPQLSSLWFLPFAYAFLATQGYSLYEYLNCGSTIKGWWNMQRMRLIRRTTSYLFAFIDTMAKQIGLSQTNFAITDKVVTEEVQKRYEKEVIDFGGSSIMLTILATVALLNLFGLFGGIMRILIDLKFNSSSQLMMQIMLSSLMVMVNLPVYEALFIRSDKGCILSSVMVKSFVLASLVCWLAIFIR